MNHWLMKSEPDVFGIETLRKQVVAPWDGVRNFQARNHMRAMAVGDQVLFYHSSAEVIGIAGLAEVARAAYPDHTSWDPQSKYFDPKSTPAKPLWSMVDVRFIAAFPRVLTLAEMRAVPELADMVLFQRSRLSVQPVEPRHYALIVKLADRPAPTGAGAAATPPPSARPRRAAARPKPPAARARRPRRG